MGKRRSHERHFRNFELNEHENTTYGSHGIQKKQYSEGIFAINCIKKQELSQINNLTYYVRTHKKEQHSKQKAHGKEEIINMSGKF